MAAVSSTADPRLPRHRLAYSLDGHTGGVLAVTFTKNGRYMMSASQDKSLRLWNPHSGLHVKTFSGAHNHEVNDVIIAEDNSKFISCGGDKQFFQWDVTSGQVVRKFIGHDRKVNALAYGPNEEVVLSASHDRTVRAWDLRAKPRAAIQVMTEATDSVLCLLAAGDEIITGSVDGCLRRYDVRRGLCVTDKLLQPIGCVSLSRGRQCMLVSTLDHAVRLIDRDTGHELASYKGHSNQRLKVQSSLDPTNAYVVSGSEDHRVCFWDLADASLLGSIKEHGAPVLCVRYSSEDTMASASADGHIKIWKVEPQR